MVESGLPLQEVRPMDVVYLCLVIVFALLLAAMAIGCARLGGPGA
jgi:hypothetical protein